MPLGFGDDDDAEQIILTKELVAELGLMKHEDVTLPEGALVSRRHHRSLPEGLLRHHERPQLRAAGGAPPADCTGAVANEVACTAPLSVKRRARSAPLKKT